MKRNCQSESALEEETIGKAQNGAGKSKLDSNKHRSGPWCRKVHIIGKKRELDRLILNEIKEDEGENEIE